MTADSYASPNNNSAAGRLQIMDSTGFGLQMPTMAINTASVASKVAAGRRLNGRSRSRSSWDGHLLEQALRHRLLRDAFQQRFGRKY